VGLVAVALAVEETDTMDDQRFDAITRFFAGGMPRRAALKAFLGAGVAAVATQSVVRRLSANTCDECGGDCTARGNTCTEPDECCGSDVCYFAECVACLEEGNTQCRSGKQDCCPGLSCRDADRGFTCLPDKNPDKKHKKKHKKH
jgi:hypothetical protein